MSDVHDQYAFRYSNVLVSLAARLESFIKDQLRGIPRIDRVSARAKDVDRFVTKANKTIDGQVKKYDDPINQIQDQIGARIITFYLADVENVSDVIKEYFRPVEEKLIVPDSEREFDYVGKHFILFIPSDVLGDDIPEDSCPKFFELQIKTLFQHAWSEANHDLGYKPESELSKQHKRQVAFTSAQAWGADHIFNELHHELEI